MTKAKILVVEDEEDFRSILTGLLEGEGYQVFSAPNGEEGLEACLRHSPDLVLLDLHLPDMDGLEICSKLRGRGFSAPILLCTIRSELATVASGLACGAVDYVLKPFEERDLLDRIRKALGRGRGSIASRRGGG